MRVEVTPEPLEPWDRVAAYQAGRAELRGRHGATAVFVGTMRDMNEDRAVRRLHLEHYPGMTERRLEALSRAATERWGLLDSLIVHRVGELRPDDPIVLVAVWSAHRREAFEACRHLMEELKSSAPFWKKEELGDGTERWVEHNTRG